MRKTNMRRILIVSLILAMLMGIMTLGIVAAEGDNAVAKIGDTKYATLQAAIDAAQPGNTVTLLKDITLGTYEQGNSSPAIVINKAITLDGNGKIFTSKAGRAINIDVNGEVEIKNLTIKQYCGRNSSDQKRCINIINQTATVKVTGCTLEMVEHNGGGRWLTSYVAGVQAATGSNHNIVIDGCTIKTIYGVVIYAAGSEIDIKNSNISNALYGAWINAECDIDVVNSTITTKEDMGTNNLGVGFLVQATGASVVVDENTTINVPAPKGEDGTQTGGQAYAMYSSAKMADLGTIDLGVATVNKTDTTDPVIYLAGAQAQINRPGGTVMYDTLEEAIENLTDEDHLGQLESLDEETEITNESVNEKLEELGRDFYFDEAGEAQPTAVVKIGETPYGTLAEAIEKATAGQTITFLADINENVTINKNLTIDGGNFKYTGTMTLGAGRTVTIQNVNFVNGGVDKAKKYKGTTGDYTIKNCTFDGEGEYAYPLRFYGANSIEIENCSVEDYLYSFLYIPSSAINVSVKNVTVENCPNYAIYFASGVTNATIEGLTVTNSNNGFIINNTENRALTIKNCKMENVGTAIKDNSGTCTITVKVLGTNEFYATTISQYVVFVGCVSASDDGTYTLVENHTAGTAVKENEVAPTVDAKGSYDSVVYCSVCNKELSRETVEVPALVAVAQVGDTKYESLQEAIDAAKDGETVTLLKDITITDADIIKRDGLQVIFNVEGNKNITLNMNEKKIDVVQYTGTTDLVAIIRIEDGAGLTVEGDGTIDVHVEGNPIKVIYMFWKLGKNGHLIINNGTYHMTEAGDSMIYANAERVVTVNGGKFTLDSNGTRENGFPWIFNTKGNNQYKIVVTGGTFNYDINHQYWCFEVEVAKNLALQKNANGTWTVVEAVAYVGEVEDNNYIHNVGYATLQEAIDAAKDGETVTLLKDITITDADIIKRDGLQVIFNVEGNKNITLNMNGKKIDVVKYTGTTDLVAIIRIEDGAGLTVEGEGTIDVHVEGNPKKVIYMFWKLGKNGHLIINDGTYHMTEAGDSMIYTNADKVVTVNGGEFTLDSNGTRENGFPWIFNTKGSNQYKIVVTGGTFNYDINHQYWCFEVEVAKDLALQKNANGTWTVVKAVAYVGEVEDNNYIHNVGYATFEEALEAAIANAPVAAEKGKVTTITLLVDTVATDVVNLNGAILNLNECTFTGTVLGTVQVNGGLWITAEDFKMIGVDAEYYISSDAVVNVAANELTIVSGTVTLAQSWRTLQGQNLTVAEGATFTVPAGMTFEIYDNTSVVVNGTLTVNGTVELKMGATLTAPSGLNVVTKIPYYVVQYVGGVYSPVELPDVAEVNGVNYKFLAEAIDAAKAGDTITFLAHISESVTIGKNLTIDGNNFKYTGTMTLGAVTATIQEVNFVNGGVDKAKSYKGTTGKYTIKDCTFDGEGEYAYPLRFYGANSIEIENCSVEDYLYSFLYIPSAAINVSVKNVIVEDCPSYAVYFASSVNNATFEDLTVKGSNNGFVINNTTNRNFTIKNCTMENVGTAINHSNGTSTITVKVLGNENDFGTATIGQYVKCVLTETTATLIAPKDLEVVSGVGGYKAAYADADGAYELELLTFTTILTNIRFGYTISHLFAVPAEGICNNHYAVVTIGDGDEEITVPFGAEWKKYSIDGVDHYVIEYKGLSAKQMVDEVSIQFFFGDKAVSEVVTTSVRDYAMQFVPAEDKIETTPKTEFMTLVVDMLNYGAAAQKYFNYKEEDLANKDLKEAQQEAYATKTIVDCGHDHSDDRTAQIKFFEATSVRFDNSISLVFKVKNMDPTNAENKLTAVFTYTDHKGNAKSVEVEFAEVAGEPGVYALELNTLSVADAHAIVTCTISDENGNYTVITDSVAAYVARRTAEGSTADEYAKVLYNAFMLFADSSYAYLH